MRHDLRYFLIILATFFCLGAMAQDKNVIEIHTVAAGETIYGISRTYGITIDELMNANPEMRAPGYELKKGDNIYIPYPSGNTTGNSSVGQQSAYSAKTLKVGVVLPLHNNDGDGRRMVEYYRGLLLACEDLKKEGISIEVNAYNTPIDVNIDNILAQSNLSSCDAIFGPLYTKQMKSLTSYLKNSDTKLIIPFSINGNDILSNQNIFQVYQKPDIFFDEVISHFVYRFSDYNIVVIDCNDKTSDKGVFTFNLRKKLEERNIMCKVTNLGSSPEVFARAFSAIKPNMVVLNTGRSPELTKVIARLDGLVDANPSISISLFGYTEWLMYEKDDKDKFFKYDTYIPTGSYYNPVSGKVKILEDKYRKWFKSDMMNYLPRFAITGYDHGMFFLRSLYKDGKNFTGKEADKNAMQSPMHFMKVGSNGGYQNIGFMFVHYNKDSSLSIISY
ncbi:MAG: LysM peptidoglycan-binding domain-containing protein [Prevotella sp.]|nr:LysM peptidoglycan-binding domain-containing protein [Prevotella sp.]